MDEVEETAEATSAETPVTPEARLEEGKTGSEESSDAWGRVRQLALKQLDRFMSLEPKVLRGDDPDAIHDIRVASRRLQQVLDLLYPAPRPREIRRLRRKLRRCRRTLGEVRNCDVLLDRVETTLHRKQAGYRDVWTAVAHYLHQRRTESFEKALGKLSKVNLAVFYVRLKTCLAVNGASPASDAHTHAGHHAPHLPPIENTTAEPFSDLVAQALDRVWKGFETQIDLSHRDPRAPVLHGVRIATKRLRYLIEVIHAFEVLGSAELLAWLRKLQQHLGEWHDLEVLEQMMIEMVARPEFLHDHLDLAIGVEKLILRNRTQKKSFEESYFRMTRDTAELERVKDWVAYLLASPSAAFATA